MDSTDTPRVQLLSNGSYHLMVTEQGLGFSHCKNWAITRWGEEAAEGGLGSFCYLRDVSSGTFWSTTAQPVHCGQDLVGSTFSAGRATFQRRHVEGALDIATQTDIAVAADHDVELRRVRITNHGSMARTLSVTSYLEIVLEGFAADAAHPAFEKLFVETEVLPEWQAVVCTRRQRDPAEPTPRAFHLMLPGTDASVEMSYETDRMRFIGRGRSTARPLAMDTDAALSGSVGAVLDPVAAIRRGVMLDAGQTATVDLITGIAATRADCLALIQRCREPAFADRVLATAVARAHDELGRFDGTEVEAALCMDLASSVLYVDRALRAPSSVLASNRQGQSGLWRYAISGDLPIVLLGIEDAGHLDVVRQVVRAHGYWRRHGLDADLVVLVTGGDADQAELIAAALNTVSSAGAAALVDKPGGIFMLQAGQMPETDRALLQSVARIVIAASDGLRAGRSHRSTTTSAATKLANARPAETAAVVVMPAAPMASKDGLLFDNGLGGFSADGREYVITVSADRMTPLPWVNVLANSSFGTLVSESGSASTWSENAQQFRLTPWSNDPVSDPSTEAFYIRDEDTGHVWSPTLQPTASTDAGAGPHVARHGFGYSVFEHTAEGIDSELTMFVAIDAPIKFVVLQLRNATSRTRRLSVTGYVEWVLGDERRKTAMHVGTEVDATGGALFARNVYNTDFEGRTAFFDGDDGGSDTPARSVCGDRCAFIGRDGSLREPVAMSQPRLSGTVGFALDPCAAIRLPLDLAAGQTGVLVFRLGAGTNEGEARQLVQRWRGLTAAQEALAAVKQYWTDALGAVQVQTPDRSLDILANGWLVYQTLSCRLWARNAFYQSSGAFGFRDQLQDVMALVHAVPALVREHLLRSAARQFSEGDVQHWWHPPSGRGVRTRCSDDYLWLPLATARYVQVTGDVGVLDELVHFVEGPALQSGEVSSYASPTPSAEALPLYEHCVRAVDNGLRFGAHGLPLMGSCDWNDGMNLVGVEGRGESVWLGFFLHLVLTQFGNIARRRGDAGMASRCIEVSARLRTAIQQSSWDGAWYQRAWFDDGSPLGTSGNVECRIDGVAQSWAVLSGAADSDRARSAMEALDRMLVDRDAGLIRLLDPPFDRSDPSPGYIQGYVRGVRENGGQYTHAAVWAAMAFAALGDGKRAWDLFDMLNPIQHAKSPEAVDIYKAEPYVVAGDVYALPPHTGRGGWTWYTGSAGWLYRLILESLLGLTVEADVLRVAPRMPAAWTSFKLSYRFHATTYDMAVLRASDPGVGAPGITLDGTVLAETAVHMVDDRRHHIVEVRVDTAREAQSPYAEA